MSPCHGEDRRFKSDRGRHFFYLFLSKYIDLYICSVAQSVEQRTENPCVGSSILPEAPYTYPHADVVEWQTRHLGGGGERTLVWVQVPSSAPNEGL